MAKAADRLAQYQDALALLLMAAIKVSDALHNEEQQGTALKASTDTAWEKLSFAIEATRTLQKENA